MAEPRYSIRQLLGRQMHGNDAVIGTPSSSVLEKGKFSSNDLQMYPDDYFNDWHGRFYLGTHKDTDFEVTNFEKLDGNDNKGVVTFSPDLPAITEVGDLFEMYPEYAPIEMGDAINLAISMVEEEALQDRLDDSVEIVASVYEYPVPLGFLYINQVIEESSTVGRYSPSTDSIDARHWRILLGSIPKVWFDDAYVTMTAGRRIRLIGQSAQAQLLLDADLCSINQGFLIYQAKALLHQSRISGRGADFQEHSTQMQLAQTMADRERSRISVSGRGHKVLY